MGKIRILSDAPAGLPPHTHMEPIVDFLISYGNNLAHDYRWGSNREGYFCYFSDPIDFDKLELKFEFPPTIILGRKTNMIYCEKTGCVIKMQKN